MTPTLELPAAQWVWEVLGFDVTDGGTHIFQPVATSQGWRIKRLRVWAKSAAPVIISIGENSSITIAADGCFDVSPDGWLGGHKTIATAGDCFVLIEYLWKVTNTGLPPLVTIT